ncbi:hypothetical protein [Paracidovorax wautersii]|uniref:hypothetical protein n=1 Tax=Paracidovorax wautersii TaxID=1177982 RepID=UPI0031D75F8F
MTPTLMILGIGAYFLLGTTFIAMASAAGRADRAEDLQHAREAARRRHERLALLSRAGRSYHSPLVHG